MFDQLFREPEDAMSTPEKHLPVSQDDPEVVPLRFVTAASLFDGHDAAINIMRRLIQDQGTEVIHLGHNRGVEEIVRAALQEDADAIAVTTTNEASCLRYGACRNVLSPESMSPGSETSVRDLGFPRPNTPSRHTTFKPPMISRIVDIIAMQA